MSPLLCIAVAYAIYHVTVGLLIWFIEVGRGARRGDFEGGCKGLLWLISIWIVVAWPLVLRHQAQQAERRSFTWGPLS